MLPEADDVHSDEGNVEEVGKGDYELVDKELDDYVVFVGLVGEVLLVFGELLGKRPVDLFVENIGDQNVNQVRNLRPVCVCVENTALLCPLGYTLEVYYFVFFVHKASCVKR